MSIYQLVINIRLKRTTGQNNERNKLHIVQDITINNKRNDKRFNNRGYSLFLLLGIFLKHLWLIPNRLKWQDCEIFTKLVPSQTSSTSSHRRRFVQKGVPKKLRNFTGKHLCWSLILIKLQVFRPAFLFKRDSNTAVFLRNLKNV